MNESGISHQTESSFNDHLKEERELICCEVQSIGNLSSIGHTRGSQQFDILFEQDSNKYLAEG